MATGMTKGNRLIEFSHRIERDPWRIEYDLSSSLPPYTRNKITTGLDCERFGTMLNSAARKGWTIIFA